MITAETVNGIVRFQANGLPVVSLYCRVDPGASQREVQIRVDEQARRHFRRVASMSDQLLRTDGYDVLVVGGHEYELGEFFRLLPHELRGRVAGTFSADPVATPVAEIRSSAEGILQRHQREQDQRPVDRVLELAAVGGLAALGPQDCLWVGSTSAIDTLLVRDGGTLVGVVCDESRWLAASGDICPVCGKPTRYARTSWTSSRRPSSRPAARPGRSRRTSCRRSTRRRRGCGSRPRRGRQETASHEHRESRELTVKVIVYADFDGVYSFLASQRADRLTREGTAEVDWRAVEHLPRLPVTGYKPRPGEAQPGGEAGEDDLAEAAQLALPGEHLPAGPPAVISNTRTAVSAYAEAVADGIRTGCGCACSRRSGPRDAT